MLETQLGLPRTEAGTFQILTRINCQSTELFGVHEWANKMSNKTYVNTETTENSRSEI
jgi:hypothetical protein